MDREGRRDWSLGTRVAEKRDRGGQGLPFVKERSECAVHRVLFVAAAEDIPCEDPKGRSVQTPEY